MQGPLFFRPPRNAARVFALTLCLALLAGACAHDPGSQHADSRPAAPAVQSAPAADDAAQPALTLSQARQAALSDAGVTAEEVTFSQAELAVEGGVPVYHIAFFCNGVTHTYQIHGRHGAVLHHGQSQGAHHSALHH